VTCVALAACKSSPPARPTPEPPALETMAFAPILDVDLAKFTRTKSGAYFRDVVPGTGPAATTDRIISVKYSISMPSGTVVEIQNAPVSFTLGPEVIRGWREGLSGMKVGGKRIIVVPPSLGYGDRIHGTIPPQSTLVFEIELLSVR
jgi:FKBP-type peptidyl-prolyl cis-trans isomerase